MKGLEIDKTSGNFVGATMVVMYANLIAALYNFKLTVLPPIQVLQVGMDLFTMALGVILFFFCVNDREEIEGMKLRYLMLTLATFFALFLDAFLWVTDGIKSIRLISIIVETLFFSAAPLIVLIFYNYVLEYMEIKEEPVTKKFSVFMRSGAVVSMLVRLLNLFVPFYFSYDAEGVYHREFLYPLSNGYVYLGGVATVVLIFSFRKRIKQYQFVILLAFLLAPLIAVTFTVFFYGLTPVFAVMMAILLLMYSILNVEKSRERSEVETELSLANLIQDSMLPNLFPDNSVVPEYDLFATMTPAREVGGDFYDFFMVDEHRLAFLIADVSDKGVAAALFMAVSKSLIKMRAQLGGSPAEVLAEVDERIGRNNELGMFVTVWLGYLDLRTGEVTACNAGHDYPALLLHEKTEDYTVEKTPHGPPVAFIPGMPFPEITFTMAPGDRIFLYTDGVNEAQGADGVEFGVSRMLAVLNEHKELGSEALCHTMRQTVDAFVGKDPQFDDMTMLALTFRGYETE